MQNFICINLHVEEMYFEFKKFRMFVKMWNNNVFF